MYSSSGVVRLSSHRQVSIRNPNNGPTNGTLTMPNHAHRRLAVPNRQWHEKHWNHRHFRVQMGKIDRLSLRSGIDFGSPGGGSNPSRVAPIEHYAIDRTGIVG